MKSIRVKRGLDIKLAGKPASEVIDIPASGIVSIYPKDLGNIKTRLLVSEGDRIKRGAPLLYDKRNPEFKLRCPAAGTVKAVVIGQRRAIERIDIELGDDETETLKRYSADQLLRTSREELLAHIQDSGCISFIQQRPFSRMANPKDMPKSIFVNGMATAPFQADPNVVLRGQHEAFQAGLNALTRLTDGKVHLCLDARTKNPTPALSTAKNVQIHHFDGPHPAGNTSTHIHFIDPIKPHDVVWAVKATDLVLIGRLLTEGTTPDTQVIAVGGPGVKEEARKHYRVRLGESIGQILKDKIADGEMRIVRGDVLSGSKSSLDEGIRCHDTGLSVLPEDRERHLLGWIMPGLLQYSVSRSFLSRWLRPNKIWSLGSSTHGNLRAMVLTGLYDKYVPLNIMTDYLVRAVLAHDSDEAIKLGILETDPEDFALCSFVCPSKMDLMTVIRQGLDQIESEGI